MSARNRQYSEAELLSVFDSGQCFNLIKYLAFNCGECLFNKHCQYHGKDNYAKKRQVKKEEEDTSVMLPPVQEEPKTAPKKAQPLPNKAPKKEEKVEMPSPTKVAAPKKAAPLKKKSAPAPVKSKAAFLFELED